MSEVQPSSRTREEFLIVIDYLMNKAYDEKHASNQAKINDFAKKYYHTTIRRERINQILIHLKQLSDSKDFHLPFKIEEKELDVISRYYVTKRFLSEQDVIELIRSIRSDNFKSATTKKRLEEELISLTIPEEKEDAFKEDVDAIYVNSNNIDQADEELIKKLERAKKRNELVTFSIDYFDYVDISNNEEDIREDARLGRTLEGYVHSLIRVANTGVYVVFYLPVYKAALVSLIDFIKVSGISNIYNKKVEIGYFIDNPESPSVNIWLHNKYHGKIDKEFELIVGIDKEQSRAVVHKFNSFYNCSFLVRKEPQFKILNFRNTDGEVGCVEIKEGLDYIKVRTNLSSFLHFYADNLKLISHAHILNYPKLNDLVFKRAFQIIKSGAENYASEPFNHKHRIMIEGDRY